MLRVFAMKTNGPQSSFATRSGYIQTVICIALPRAIHGQDLPPSA